MKAIVTGANGAVGSALMHELRLHDVVAVAWDRAAIPIDDYRAMESFVAREKPDVLFHLALASEPTGMINEQWRVNYEWPSELAWITHKLGVRFVFTSSVMVYTEKLPGPYTLDRAPDATEGYGHDKLIAEQRVRSQNADSLVVRLGWQIGSTSGSNNMIDFLARQMANDGVVRASRRWLPACSFLPDTAAALRELSRAAAPDVYLLDGNRGHSFYDIVCALNAHHGYPWRVEPTDDFVYDQRMIDPRVPIAPLSERLTNLPPLPADRT